MTIEEYRKKVAELEAKLQKDQRKLLERAQKEVRRQFFFLSREDREKLVTEEIARRRVATKQPA